MEANALKSFQTHFYSGKLAELLAPSRTQLIDGNGAI